MAINPLITRNRDVAGFLVVTADNRSYRATIQRDAEKSRPVRRLGVCCDVVGEGRRFLS